VFKDVRIRGYFSKPKGVREQKCLENTALEASTSTLDHLQKERKVLWWLLSDLMWRHETW